MLSNGLPEDRPSDTDESTATQLTECPLCGCIGLEERTRPQNHDCSEFLTDAALDALGADE
jgi:hypothetical protein